MTTRRVVLILFVLAAVSAAAWNGGGWVIHKVRVMHGLH